MSSQHAPIEPPKDHTVADLTRDTLIAAIEQIPFASLATPLVAAALPSKSQQAEAKWQQDVSAAANAAARQLKIIAIFLNTTIKANVYQQQAGKAADLSFFRGGMVTTLEKIAAGKAIKQDFTKLRGKLQETKDDVEHIIADIELAMSRFVENDPFREKMHDAIYGQYGKLRIREKIEALIETDAKNENVRRAAEDLCVAIDNFNRAVSALGREAAETLPTELQIA